MFQIQILLPRKVKDTTGSSNDNVWALVFQQILVSLDCHAAIEDRHLDLGKIGGEAFELVADLNVRNTAAFRGQTILRENNESDYST